MSDCVEWIGAKTNGYGVFRLEQRNYYAHRVAFYMAHGYWPLECRHTCDNKACYNFEHLLDGTHADNMRDASERKLFANSRKTHCPRGHEYTPENTRLYKNTRTCRTCDNTRGREKRAKDRANGLLPKPRKNRTMTTPQRKE